MKSSAFWKAGAHFLYSFVWRVVICLCEHVSRCYLLPEQVLLDNMAGAWGLVLLVAAPGTFGELEVLYCTWGPGCAVLGLLLLVALLQTSMVRNWDYGSMWMGERKCCSLICVGGCDWLWAKGEPRRVSFIYLLFYNADDAFFFSASCCWCISHICHSWNTALIIDTTNDWRLLCLHKTGWFFTGEAAS